MSTLFYLAKSWLYGHSMEYGMYKCLHFFDLAKAARMVNVWSMEGKNVHTLCIWIKLIVWSLYGLWKVRMSTLFIYLANADCMATVLSMEGEIFHIFCIWLKTVNLSSMKPNSEQGINLIPY